MKARWIVDGPKLTARRIARGMTSADLARRAGISLRTLGRYERGTNTLAQVDHLRAAARVPHVPVEAIGKPPDGPASESAQGEVTVPDPYATLLERVRGLATTGLETLVALEARLPPPRHVPHDGTPVPVLTARKLQNVFSAFATYDGERFAVTGMVARQRAASVDESALIGCRQGISVCFLMAHEITHGVDLKVTVHTGRARETRSLQKAFEEERETCAIVRVTLVPDEALKESRGFGFFTSTHPMAWGFVVEAVV